MRNFVISLILVGVMVGTASADFETKPTLIFTPETCMLRITPQDGILLEGWSICVTDRQFLGAVHESEDIACDELVAITEHYSIDMTPYVDNCLIALPSEGINFGTIKSYYR